jgi:hypothetical protein
MKIERENFLSIKKAVIIIQKRFQAFLSMKYYRKLKTSAVLIQRKFRAIKVMKSVRKEY